MFSHILVSLQQVSNYCDYGVPFSRARLLSILLVVCRLIGSAAQLSFHYYYFKDDDHSLNGCTFGQQRCCDQLLYLLKERSCRHGSYAFKNNSRRQWKSSLIFNCAAAAAMFQLPHNGNGQLT